MMRSRREAHGAAPRALARMGHRGGLAVARGIGDVRAGPAAVWATTRAEIDAQRAAARRSPRSPGRFLAAAKALATLDCEVAAGCTYATRRGRGVVTAPSAGLAEIVAVAFGNLRLAARVTGRSSRSVTARAACLDLETNVAASVEARRPSADAALAIAGRDAIFRVVPGALVEPIQRAAMRCAAGSIEDLPARRAEALRHFVERGVPRWKVLRALEVERVEDIAPDHLPLLWGFAAAIRDGEATPESIFDPRPAPVRPRGHPVAWAVTEFEERSFAPGTSGRITTEPDDDFAPA
jgi:hypothetical protein